MVRIHGAFSSSPRRSSVTKLWLRSLFAPCETKKSPQIRTMEDVLTRLSADQPRFGEQRFDIVELFTQRVHLRDARGRVGSELLRPPCCDMRLQILPRHTLDASFGVALERIVRVRDEEACFGEFEVDVHASSVPIVAAAALGPKTLRNCIVSTTSWVRTIVAPHEIASATAASKTGSGSLASTPPASAWSCRHFTCPRCGLARRSYRSRRPSNRAPHRARRARTMQFRCTVSCRHREGAPAVRRALLARVPQ